VEKISEWRVLDLTRPKSGTVVTSCLNDCPR
jgi:hypothetical protein